MHGVREERSSAVKANERADERMAQNPTRRCHMLSSYNEMPIELGTSCEPREGKDFPVMNTLWRALSHIMDRLDAICMIY